MKILNNKKSNLLLFAFIISSVITIITHNIILIIVSVFIGIIIISSLRTPESVNKTPITSKPNSIDNTEAELSFFDDFRLDD